VGSKVRLLLPRRESWRLWYDRVEMVGVLRKELREKMRTERPMGYFTTSGTPEGGGTRQADGWVRRCWQAGGWQAKHCTSVCRLSGWCSQCG
jgi:hypothetical protein